MAQWLAAEGQATTLVGVALAEVAGSGGTGRQLAPGTPLTRSASWPLSISAARPSEDLPRKKMSYVCLHS
jgi:hypothetical protein